MNAQPVDSPRSRFHLFLVALFALSVGNALHAQQPEARPADGAGTQNGFHFAVALGSASVGATCTTCTFEVFPERINGFSGTIQLGGAITRRLIVAGEFMGWVRNDVPIYRRIAALNLVFIGYPSEGSGFFVKGGGGGLRAIVEDDFLIAQTDAFTSQIGVGFDISMGGRLNITPQVTYVTTFSGTTTLNGISTSPAVVAPNLIQFGIGLTVH
jgi:hypothetical protein